MRTSQVKIKISTDKNVFVPVIVYATAPPNSEVCNYNRLPRQLFSIIDIYT